MMDLGDLREGYMNEDELIKDAVFIEKHLKNITLYGVGTNLGCYGSIKPDFKQLNQIGFHPIQLQILSAENLILFPGALLQLYQWF